VSAGRQALARRSADHRYDTVALTGTAGGKTIDWLEKVSDEQYRKR
jgi:hypothetical protein